jgi:hypothetical protein
MHRQTRLEDRNGVWLAKPRQLHHDLLRPMDISNICSLQQGACTMRYRVWLRMEEASYAPLAVEATIETEAFENAQAKAYGLDVIDHLDWVREELNVQATAEIDQVSEVQFFSPRLPSSDKATFIWVALRALTAQGVILSHHNVQQWIALNRNGVTVSPRHYRRIKRLFCKQGGLAG